MTEDVRAAGVRRGRVLVSGRSKGKQSRSVVDETFQVSIVELMLAVVFRACSLRSP